MSKFYSTISTPSSLDRGTTLGGQLMVKSKTKGNNLNVKLPTPSVSQIKWLKEGLNQPGDKLPLFDLHGKI